MEEQHESEVKEDLIKIISNHLDYDEKGNAHLKLHFEVKDIANAIIEKFFMSETLGISVKDERKFYGCPYCGRCIRKTIGDGK